MNIYCFSGLGADKRVFQNLQIDWSLTHIDWLPVSKGTSIEEYAKQLASMIDTGQEHLLIGVSFGGLIAMEVAKITNPKLTIIISSAEVRSELKPLHRLTGNLRLTKLIPTFLIKPPAWLLAFLFGTKRKPLLKAIIKDSDPKFMKWAIHALSTWKNETRGSSVLKISGDKDKLMRINKDAAVIKGGKHLMIMDQAMEVSTLINHKIRNVSTI